MAERTLINALSGSEKAAMFLLASGEEYASKLFTKL